MTYVRSVPPTHLSGCNELLPLGVAVSLCKKDRFNAFSLQAKTSVSTITSAADEVTLRCGLLSRHLETEQREGGSCNGLWPVQAVRVSHTSRWDWNIVHKHIKGWNVIAGTAGTHYLIITRSVMEKTSVVMYLHSPLSSSPAESESEYFFYY